MSDFIYKVPIESVRLVQIKIRGHHVHNHVNIQLQAMMSESWRELSDWGKGRIEGRRKSI